VTNYASAALYDIHGNLPALEAVPMSRECLDKLYSIRLPIHFIQGNCETAVLAQMNNQRIGLLPESVSEDICWTANQLLPVHQKLLTEQPKTITLTIAGLNEVLFCHATPRSENENFTRFTPENKLKEIFKMVDESCVVC
jgi:hypothetical protein